LLLNGPDGRTLATTSAAAAAAAVFSPAHQLLLGFSGTWALQPKITLSNNYFKLLMGLDWTKRSGFGREEYMASGEDAARVLNLEFDFEMEGQSVYMTPEDLVIKQDTAFAAIARSYAVDNQLFLSEFAAAWTKVMNADRFKGPAGNVCRDGMPEAPAGRATDVSDSVLSEVTGDVLT
jgi:catalase (peroxidase I)